MTIFSYIYFYFTYSLLITYYYLYFIAEDGHVTETFLIWKF